MCSKCVGHKCAVHCSVGLPSDADGFLWPVLPVIDISPLGHSLEVDRLITGNFRQSYLPVSVEALWSIPVLYPGKYR